MGITDAQRRAKNKYDAKTYTELRIKPRKKEAEQIKRHAEQRGESLTRFLCRAADTQMLLDGQTDAAVLDMLDAAELENELADLPDLPRGKSKRKK